MNEETAYVIEMKVSVGGMKCLEAEMALARCDAAHARIAARVDQPGVER